MKKLLAVAAALFTLHSWAGSDSFIDCESLVYCRAPAGTLRAYETTAIFFTTTAPTPYNISAQIWSESACKGDVDHTCEGSGFIATPGEYYLISDVERPEGWAYSVQWAVEGCPEQPCIYGTIGDAPDICKGLEATGALPQ